MNRSGTWLCVGVFGITSGVLTWLCLAAPFLPAGRRLPDEVISLAGIDRVQVRVRPVARLLSQRGVTAELIERELEEGLERAGFEVVENEGVPTIEVKSLPVNDPAIPDAMAFDIQISVYQSVHIGRLNRKLVVPTYMDVNIALDRSDKIEDAAIACIAEVLGRFRDAVRVATRRVEAE